METVTRNLILLEERVHADVEEQEQQEKHIQQQRRERVNKLREERQAVAGNGHTQEAEEKEFNTNPFRPISELTVSLHEY